MSTGTLIGVGEYLRTSFRPDCDFVDGQLLERNVGTKKHSYAQSEIVSWFNRQKSTLNLQALAELRVRIGPGKIRIPDVLVCEIPLPDEEVFTIPPYLCVEVMSPDDTISAMQDRLDDYLQFGVQNIWVIDPWKHRGWNITADGWALVPKGAVGLMRTADGRIAMPLADVLLP
jgi:Uma2 family endonuclease